METVTANTDLRLPDFLIIPFAIINDKSLQPSDKILYGIIYWYSKQKLEKCILSNRSLGQLAQVTDRSVRRSLVNLSTGGYVSIVYDDQNHRLEIAPNVIFATVTRTELSSPPDIPVHRIRIFNNISTNVDRKQVSTKAYGNENINRILKEFTEITGLSKPSDRQPRFAANTFLKSKDRDIEMFRPCLEYLFKTKGFELTSIGAINRHFPLYARDILKRSERKLTAEEQEWKEMMQRSKQ